MPIKDNTVYSALEAYARQKVERYERALLRTLKYAAETAVNTARERGSYTDRTGNLRSSVGAIITVDGATRWTTGFRTVGGGGEGRGAGKAFAEELAAKFDRGIALVVVAGMNYAVHVSNTGRDVLDSARLEAEKLVPRLLKDLSMKR